MTKKIYHRCVICGAAFLQIAKTISRHLQNHQINLQTYYEQVRSSCESIKPTFIVESMKAI